MQTLKSISEFPLNQNNNSISVDGKCFTVNQDVIQLRDA